MKDEGQVDAETQGLKSRSRTKNQRPTIKFLRHFFARKETVSSHKEIVSLTKEIITLTKEVITLTKEVISLTKEVVL